MHKSPGKASAPLLLGALGVVFGDIGTSPIYAFGLAFDADGPFRPERAEILGTLSLIVWSLILIVSVKYVLLILRVDNNGEGGILALMARAQRGPSRLFALRPSCGAAWFAGHCIFSGR